MSILSKNASKKVVRTPFSNFIRDASSKEKKRVYARVLKKASERQTEVVSKAESGTHVPARETCSSA